MNKQRRKEIYGIARELTDIKTRLQKIFEDESEYYDNIPENLLSSEMAEISEEAIEILEEVIDRLEEI